MFIKSYSKLNLSLKILKKQTNGLHDISSYNCLINLYDKIHIKKRRKRNTSGDYDDINKIANQSIMRSIIYLEKSNRQIKDYLDFQNVFN